MVGPCAVTRCKKKQRNVTDECYVRSDSEGTEDEESLVKRLEPRTFHRFPVDTELKKIWLNNIDRVDWNISNYARICSDHFKESDINRIANKNIRRNRHAMLKPGAVPTRFKTTKRKLIHRTVMLKENPPPVEELESQDSPSAVSDLTYFDTASPSKRITRPRTENEMEENEILDQFMVNSNYIEIEPANIKVEIDPYFISEDEEFREEVSEAIPNHNTMMNEIIMLNDKLRKALLKINSYEKLNSKEKTAKVENEKYILEKKLAISKRIINSNEKKMKSLIDSYKKKMILKNKKIIQLQQNNNFSVEAKERLTSKYNEIRVLKQSNRRLVATREKLKKIIRELKKISSDRKIDSEKNKLDLIYGTSDFEVYPDEAQHHTFEIVERWKNDKVIIFWRKKETISIEDGNGSAEDVFDRRKNDVHRKIHEDVFVTKLKEKRKEKCNDSNEDAYSLYSNEINKGNLYISRKITKTDSIHNKGLPILEIGIPSIESSCLNDESKICERYDGLDNFLVEDKSEEQPNQMKTHNFLVEDKAEEQPNQMKTEWTYQCNHCDKCLSSKASLLSHQRIHSKPYECSLCGKCFSRNSTLTQHLRLHTGEKPYKCSHCSKSFAHLPNFRRHKKMHTGEKPYKCDVCDNKFTRKESLEEHMLKHTGENNFCCTECGKCFFNKHTLANHQRIHTGEKPYLCSYCGKGFTKGTILEKHKRIHTGEKPYKCSHCGKCYSRNCELAQHLRKHTGEKSFLCNKCGKSYAHYSSMAYHKKICKLDD